MWRMAMVSVPSGRVTTAGRLATESVERMPTLGTLMIGALMNEPNGPGLVMVNVLPDRSSGSSFPALALSASARMPRANRAEAEVLGATHATSRPGPSG